MKFKYRTVFISDLHLGMKGCQAKQVARFLKRVQCEKLYLVGDIIDMWWLKSRWYWPADHNTVIRRILTLANRGTEVIFVPGNHDGAARSYLELEFGGVKLRRLDIHETADGRRLLVTHGDEYDLVVKHSPLLSRMGGLAYGWLVRINAVYNHGRRMLGLKYWSLSQYVKLKVKRACTFISRFEQTLIHEARRRELDGVVCGHIHKAEHRVEDGVEYFNCGDWVESCTVLVEHDCGKMEVLSGLELLEQHDQQKQQKRTLTSRLLRRDLPTEEGCDMDFEADEDLASLAMSQSILLAARQKRTAAQSPTRY